MEFKFKVRIGSTDFEISDKAENLKEFIEKVSLFQELPTIGPNGEADLKLVFRSVKGYDYYSIVSESAKKEFKLGQSKTTDGKLFPKGWSELFEREESETQEVSPISKTPTPSISKTTPSKAPPTINKAPAPKSLSLNPTTKSAETSTEVKDVLKKYGITGV
ncbi:MAG: hypothetical protein MOGMAGMI_00369 [Candidatus Omnitrophica bacterium]|nr:hypothetical protein [Candidatus Omnitrophota bacterium]